MRALILAAALALPAATGHAYTVFEGYGVTEYSGEVQGGCYNQRDACPLDLDLSPQELVLTFMFEVDVSYEGVPGWREYVTYQDVHLVAATLDGRELGVSGDMISLDSYEDGQDFSFRYGSACGSFEAECGTLGANIVSSESAFEGHWRDGSTRSSYPLNWRPGVQDENPAFFGDGEVRYSERIFAEVGGDDFEVYRFGVLRQTGGYLGEVPLPPAFAMLGAAVAAAGFFVRRRA